ncbi:MAG: hypothetical protein LBG80_16675 [Bacteroidales bacterium]|jgi:hypothetical protein|nr:hypothetical protein [Bacteroidales bacterium]
MLAFAGQKLSEIADKFAYNHAPPTNHESILFKVKTSEIKQLSKIIPFIFYGYDNDLEDEEMYFLDEVYDFIEEVNIGRYFPLIPIL